MTSTLPKYRLGISIAHGDRAVVLLKDQVPVKILVEKHNGAETTNFEIITLIKSLLAGQAVGVDEIDMVCVAAPWRSTELEDDGATQWLLPLRNLRRQIQQDWSFRAETKEQLLEIFGEEMPLHFFAEDQCRSAFTLRRFSQQESLVLNLHSRPDNHGSTIWKLGPGEIKPLIAFEQDESLEFLLNNLAHFAGFTGPQAIRGFLNLARMGEESLLDKLYGVVNVDSDGRVEVDVSQLEASPGGDSTYDDLTKLFGAPRAPELPVTVREVDLAASAMSILKTHVNRLSECLIKDQGPLPLIIQSESMFGDILKAEFEELGLFSEVQWLREKEAVAEALGAGYNSMGEHINWSFEASNWQPLSYTQIFKDGDKLTP